MAKDNSWKKICEQTEMLNHDFSVSPFEFIASEIKKACQDFEKMEKKDLVSYANKIREIVIFNFLRIKDCISYQNVKVIYLKVKDLIL